jgi:hypothetical protein
VGWTREHNKASGLDSPSVGRCLDEEVTLCELCKCRASAEYERPLSPFDRRSAKRLPQATPARTTDVLEEGVCMTLVVETGQWLTLWACERGAVPKKDTLAVRAVGLGGRTADPGYVPRWSVRCMDVHKE